MLKRNLEKKIKEYLNQFPCVVLIGARQVGKSTLLKKVLPKAKFYDLENLSDFDFINVDPQFFLENQKETIIIDEAQHCPNLFKALRVSIDQDRQKTGRYLLSGSSSPQLLNNISESLAGRVAIVDIPCLAWNEALAKPKSRFYDFLDTPAKFSSLKALYSREELLELCFYGLYPEPFLARADINFYRAWQENYFRTYIERDVRALFPNLELEKYRKLIMMLAQSSGETIKYSNYATSLGISEPTVKKYLEIAEGTFIWSKLQAFDRNSKKRLIKMPKGYLRDTLLINYSYKLHDLDQMQTQAKFGLIWESFVQEQIHKNLQNILPKPSFYYYRTQNKAEIDLVIESSKSLIPIEIKTGSSFKKDQLTNLKHFIEEFSCPYGLIINNANEIRQLSEKIYQVPACFI
ncbi:MAG: ATP-binding protein [Cyanobacteria bacterium]|nr:ATP-binding protein [Cyanobacteriota bacterium]